MSQSPYLDILRAITTEAVTSETPWDIVEILNGGVWEKCQMMPNLSYPNKFRIKPKNITVNGYEVEAGLTSLECLDKNDVIYFPAFNEDLYDCCYPDSYTAVPLFHFGIAYTTEQGAINRAKAMLGFNPNLGV
jgi:hypothetical protein